MRRYLYAFTVLLWLSVRAVAGNVDYVNMYVGTDAPNEYNYAGIWPQVGAPFAMTGWSAATQRNCISATVYRYNDPYLIGFQATHQPAVWMADYGFMTLMPETGRLRTAPETRAVSLDHNREKATPYYYSLSFNSAEGDIRTELTATSRCSMLRITYPARSEGKLFIEAFRQLGQGSVSWDASRREVVVTNSEQMNPDHVKGGGIGPRDPKFACTYVLRFSVPVKEFGTCDNGAYVTFEPREEPVVVSVGSSFIDRSQAAANLAAEIPEGQSFDDVCQKVKQQWNDLLGKVQLTGASETDKAIFYTAFMHTLQFPREFSEQGRYYSPFDSKVHEGTFYDDYSLWDTFRSEHPWLQLVQPERVSGMMEALVSMYKQGGWLPKWPNPTYSGIMIGSHADAVIADAYVNGFRDFDTQTALEALLKDAYVPPTGDGHCRWTDRGPWTGNYESRGGLTNYLSQGYVAYDKTSESVSRTLEFALDDYCIAQMARAMGRTDKYDDLMRRARNYTTLWNAADGFFRARGSDGKWCDNPEEGFTEGGKWTYRFCFMQDVEGGIKLFGGREPFVKALDANFDGGHYEHPNEPGHHYVYLYDYAGRLDKTQERIPQIRRDNYHNSIDGLSGNDDCGQMSSWYLFSCLGFYPVCSASGVYALGMPTFKELTLALSGGRKLVVKAPELGRWKTLTDVRWNGRRLKTPFVRVRDIMQGGVLEFRHKKGME